MGEVFTDEKHRDKGIATSLLDVAIDNFRKDGGKAIFITNLCPLAPHKIYQKIGFQAYGYGRQDYGGIIRLVLNSKGEDFDLKYFEHDPSTTIREINWGDLPHFTYLLNYPHPWLVRAYSFGLIGFCVFDEFGRSFMNLMHTLKKHNFGFVLENSRHRVVGTAFSSSLQAESQSHVRIVDLLVHPNYLQESTQLLQILCDKLGSEKTEKLQAYASAKDDSKVKTLRACGFRKEATMRRQLRLGEEKVDLQIYSKSFRE
jgi:L-amino acid N-acyltransferase YncA